MFLWLSELLRDQFGALNVFRYVTFRTIGAMGTSLLIAMALYPWFIRRLQARQIGQVVRSDGPETHFSKAGTPTMGGVLILVAIAVSVLAWGDIRSAYVWLTMIPTVVFGILGFIDDYLKIRFKNSKGVTGRQKLAVQFLTAAGVCWAMYSGALGSQLADTRMYIPFVSAQAFSLLLPAWLYGLGAAVGVVGLSNAVNLTDGLDGLAIVPVMVASATFAVLCYLSGGSIGLEVNGTVHRFVMSDYLLIPSVPGAQELTVVAAAVIGAGVGFLWYNTFPAQVFMGDVGALALGGTLGMFAILSKNELLTLIIGGIFVVEALSVITQTTSYKLTGKRVFRMAPIHHHFEKKGWPEPRVTVRFWIISIVLALIALSSLKLR
ncbi:MAG TPA: phospho-N-acetylmuramoyl-pentapeptide-transferase [Myxococcales bacterium]|nr:phospho-N-acetylmuramoyl-pentapeptide-transferase [Myxococcales bacterium]HAN31948.1 phospho-N-acetylmuramoyl-pentapeptide-transferase [Myxococcales bacterium]